MAFMNYQAVLRKSHFWLRLRAQFPAALELLVAHLANMAPAARERLDLAIVFTTNRYPKP